MNRTSKLSLTARRASNEQQQPQRGAPVSSTFDHSGLPQQQNPLPEPVYDSDDDDEPCFNIAGPRLEQLIAKANLPQKFAPFKPPKQLQQKPPLDDSSIDRRDLLNPPPPSSRTRARPWAVSQEDLADNGNGGYSDDDDEDVTEKNKGHESDSSLNSEGLMDVKTWTVRSKEGSAEPSSRKKRRKSNIVIEPAKNLKATIPIEENHNTNFRATTKQPIPPMANRKESGGVEEGVKQQRQAVGTVKNATSNPFARPKPLMVRFASAGVYKK